MSLGVKQGGRYILAAFAGVDIAAALAYWRLGESLRSRRPHGRRLLRPAMLAGLPLFALSYIVPAAPYYLAHYNWLVGGAPVAARVIDMGLGEGLDQAARYLNALPNAKELTVASAYREAFAPYFVGTSTSLTYEHVYRADYVVFYIDQWQKRPDWSLWREYQDREPLHTISLQGIPYARIYATERPTDALSFLHRHAAPDDRVVFEIPSLMQRDYQGAAPAWLPDGDDVEESVAERVDLVRDAAYVWRVVYPRSRGAFVDIIDEVLDDIVAAHTHHFADLHIEQIQLASH
jgi:hypothetical protein